jgi:amino acid transporter
MHETMSRDDRHRSQLIKMSLESSFSLAFNFHILLDTTGSWCLARILAIAKFSVLLIFFIVFLFLFPNFNSRHKSKETQKQTTKLTINSRSPVTFSATLSRSSEVIQSILGAFINFGHELFCCWKYERNRGELYCKRFSHLRPLEC